MIWGTESCLSRQIRIIKQTDVLGAADYKEFCFQRMTLAIMQSKTPVSNTVQLKSV